jgi:hypothetical protein
VANLPPLSTTLAAKLSPVSTTQATNLPLVSTTLVANFATSYASFVDTGGKFATGVNLLSDSPSSAPVSPYSFSSLLA